MPNTSHCQMGDKEAGASEKGPNAEDDDSPNQTQRRYKFVLNKNRFHTFLSFCRRIVGETIHITERFMYQKYSFAILCLHICLR